MLKPLSVNLRTSYGFPFGMATRIWPRAGLMKARQMVEKDIGFVGEVTSVDPSLLSTLVDAGYLPVVASVAADSHGQALNVNADTAAGEVGCCCTVPTLLCIALCCL